MIDNGQCQDPNCPWCAREFFRWLKSRMTQMSFEQGNNISFAEAASTSVIPPRDGTRAIDQTIESASGFSFVSKSPFSSQQFQGDLSVHEKPGSDEQ